MQVFILCTIKKFQRAILLYLYICLLAISTFSGVSAGLPASLSFSKELPSASSCFTAAGMTRNDQQQQLWAKKFHQKLDKNSYDACHVTPQNKSKCVCDHRPINCSTESQHSILFCHSTISKFNH